jgi:hypothetical protein
MPRPFQVHTPHGTVTALGTAFDLAVQGNSSVVTVTEHRVRVDSGSASMQAIEGQQLRFDGQHRRRPAGRPALAWRERRLHWVSALAEVTQGLDRWHGGHTWIIGAHLRQQPVTLLGSADGAASNRDQLATQLHACCAWARACRCGCRHAGNIAMHPDIGPAAASTQDDDALRQPLELPMLFHRPLVLALSLACASPLPLLPASATRRPPPVTSIFLRSRWPARWMPTAG